ncbi:MAG: putative metal-binding motif-containing protein, partial [Myxococcota bacterium]
MRLTLLLATLLVTACNGDTPKDTGTEDTGGGNPDMVDADSDGYLISVDCDDANAAVHPGAEETCDGVDEDCDGTPDDDAGTAWYVDADGDGFGTAANWTIACEAPAGMVEDGSDCDDADPAYNPGAAEDDCADPADYNCDGSVGYADADGDGFAACLECDDADGAVNPSATDACNGVDDDCDGSTDEDGLLTFYADADGDGFGDPALTASGCEAPVGYVAVAGDCNDADTAYNPAVTEDCATPTDFNCDGSVGYADA